MTQVKTFTVYENRVEVKRLTDIDNIKRQNELYNYNIHEYVLGRYETREKGLEALNQEINKVMRLSGSLGTYYLMEFYSLVEAIEEFEEVEDDEYIERGEMVECINIDYLNDWEEYGL